MELKEIQILLKVASSVIVTFTTEQNLEKIHQIRENIEDMAGDTVDFAKELIKDSTATAKIVEQLILDVMVAAGLDTPKMTTRGIEKDVLKALRKEIQTQFEAQRPKPEILDNEKAVVE